MKTFIRRIEPSIVRLGILALLALTALWPPGSYHTLALAADDPGAPTLQQSGQIFLPLVRGSGVVPDLRFTPDSVNLTPGAEARVTVRVEPQADLGGATFELPGVQAGVSSRFEAAADGASGTLTLAASTTLEADDRALTVQGRSGVGTGTWVGALKVTTTGTLTAKTIFVDAVNGKDSNDGTQTKPFKTLKKALTKVVAGDTVKLLPGNYSKQGSGDTFPVLVPAGVTIVGTVASNGAKQSFLSASSSTASETGLTFAGDATVRDLELDVFGTALSASTSKLTLSNLNFILNRVNVDLKGAAQATLTKGNVFMGSGSIGARLIEQARLTMDGGKINGSGPNCEQSGGGIAASNAAQVTLKNGAILENIPGVALSLKDTAKAALELATITRTNPAGCAPKPSIQGVGSTTLTLAGAHLSMTGGVFNTSIGIDWQSDAPLTVNGSSLIEGHTAAGIKLTERSATSNTTFFMTGSSINSNQTGIDARFLSDKPNASITVTTSDLVGNQTAITARTLRLRLVKVANNSTGIILSGHSADLGTAAEPGQNLFDNVNQGVVIDNSGNGNLVSAVGNTWKADTQGADSNGHYAPRTTFDGTSPLRNGLNFTLVRENSKIQF